MSSAVVIGASGGIGKALEEALIEEGAFDRVYGFSRSESGDRHLDLEDEASIAAAAARVGSPTLVIVATGLLHEVACGSGSAGFCLGVEAKGSAIVLMSCDAPAAKGWSSHGRCFRLAAPHYISSVVIYTKYSEGRLSDSTAHG